MSQSLLNVDGTLRVRHTLLAAIFLVLSCAMLLRAEEPQPKPVDFARDIQPIFVARCNDCHGPDAQEGQLRLDAKTIVMKGGVSGRLLEPGKGKTSLLIRRLLGEGDHDRMPLDDEPLSDEQIALIRRWIDEGAKWPDGVGVQIAPEEKHWAYVAPVRAPLPKVKDPAWLAGPIDAFILARLDKEGLQPSPPADRARLIRRVYLDLIGLPPSVEEVDAFLADDRPDAYERVAERLLASPEYGVRWSRPWLDAARYADTNGYQADQFRSVWPYRDWVVNAINDDMPFSRFTIEQLAGDLLPDATLDQKIATGFHRLTTCNVEAGVDPEENRTNQLIDRVNTTGTVWLGTTIECTQCHNHKYDPFSQKEYYQLFAYFNNTPLEVEGNGVQFNFTGPKMALPLAAEQTEQLAALKAKKQELDAQIDERSQAHLAGLADWEKTVRAAIAEKEPPEWHVLKVSSFESKGGSTYEILDDQSVLLTGKAPATDTYKVTVRTELAGITGFKLETLTHPSLPGEGPGRGDADRPNFVLNEFSVIAAETDPTTGESDPPAAVPLGFAEADFSQARFDVEQAIDGDVKTAWAINPQFHKPHHATFLTKQPLKTEGLTTLVFTLDQQYGSARTIGRLRLSAMTGTPSKSAIPDVITKIVGVAPEKRNKKQQQQLDEYYLGLDPEIKKLQDQSAAVQKQIDAVQPTTTLVMIENEMRDTNLFKRGNFLTKGEPVEPGTPRVLHDRDQNAPDDRLGLAQWLVDRDNPLTARVIVNRWWAEIFGQGIVATVEDFGTQGEPPTHRELLDYLACELMDSGWSRKHVHRLIVSSNMYRQSPKVSPELLARDPYNKLLARAPRFRLPAETIRDNALGICGLVTHKLGGPPVYPPQPAGVWRHVGRNEPKYDTSTDEDRYRRGLYVFWRRSAPYPAFTSFDAPDRASCVVQRPRTNTPLQALTLMNDPQFLEMTLALAERIAGDYSELTIDQKVHYGFRLCVSREPSAAEAKLLESVFRQELARYQETAGAAEKLVGKEAAKSGKFDLNELAAWFHVANILLNLDETVTRQ